jgi:two-component system, OmpR family, response regulator
VSVYVVAVPPRTILVVDDDPDIRRVAALSLERIGGFSVLLAGSAAEALEQAVRTAPDLVLLDVSMPGTDGPATLAALRAHPSTRQIPVVFFTAAASEDEMAHLRSLGAIGVVAKPFDLTDLPARIRDMLDGAR